MFKAILQDKKTFIIAEAGVNHNGSLSLARELIDIAAESGADAVKFQTFLAEELISINAQKACYQVKNTGSLESQLEMIKKLELSWENFELLFNYSKQKKIRFLSTAFDSLSLNFLVKKCKIPFVKIPSGELTNAPFLFDSARYNLPIVLSTGMANLEEIEQAIAVLSYGWINACAPSSVNECIAYYNTERGKKSLADNLIILHCVTEYPAPYKETNLKAMMEIADKFDCPVGLSDHSIGIHVPVAAVAMGAKLIEKHFTIDKTLPGPDHSSSLDPSELNNMVSCIRDIEDAIGDGGKVPQTSEEKNIVVARRTIVADHDLRKGDAYTAENIKCKRSKGGVSAMLYWDYLGKTCPVDTKKDFPVML